ncbi:biotin/lipoate A/B protein ligase family protein [Planctomycetota bacterium]
MAVDEALMEWSGATGGCCLRFYRWQEPTLSLGYFQVYEDRNRHAASLDCPAVRRVSGGGAILHDVEVTYSFVVPRSHRLAQGRLALYEAVHATLVEALSQWGVKASLCGGEDRKTTGQQPFLCFQRRAPGDVLVGRTKIAGSAQRRSAGAVLQHGSVLLARSAAAPELEGLEEVQETSIECDRLVHLWLENLGERLGLAWQDERLGEPELRRVAELMERKFGANSWTIDRGR